MEEALDMEVLTVLELCNNQGIIRHSHLHHLHNTNNMEHLHSSTKTQPVQNAPYSNNIKIQQQKYIATHMVMTSQTTIQAGHA